MIERPSCGARADTGTACGADTPLQVCAGQLRQLVAAHIDDDSFCRFCVQQDINGIAVDLREAHRDDFFSVPEQVSLAFICKRLRLNDKKLSEEEKKWLKKISEKSELLKNPNPQRERNKRMTK